MKQLLRMSCLFYMMAAYSAPSNLHNTVKQLEYRYSQLMLEDTGLRQSSVMKQQVNSIKSALHNATTDNRRDLETRLALAESKLGFNIGQSDLNMAAVTPSGHAYEQKSEDMFRRHVRYKEEIKLLSREAALYEAKILAAQAAGSTSGIDFKHYNEIKVKIDSLMNKIETEIREMIQAQKHLIDVIDDEVRVVM